MGRSAGAPSLLLTGGRLGAMRARSGASPGLSGRSSGPRPQGSPGAEEEAMLSRPGCAGHGDGSPDQEAPAVRGSRGGLLGAVCPGGGGVPLNPGCCLPVPLLCGCAEVQA